jgi:hypothetical protein
MVWPSRDNTSGSDEVKSATVHETEPQTTPLVVWLQFCASETSPLDHATGAIGRLVAHIVALRRWSRSVAIMLQSGPQPVIVNDLRAPLEQDIPEIACLPAGAEPRT